MAINPLETMRAEQRKLILRNTLQVLEHAGVSATRSQQAIELAMVQIRALIRTLPDGLLREQAWRALRPQIVPVLERMALAVGRDLVLEAATMVPEQVLWATSYLETGFPGDAPGAAAARRALTGENNPFAARTVEAFPGATYTAADLGRLGASPELLGQLQVRVPPAVMAQVQNIRIDGGTLQGWFGQSVIVDRAGGTIGGVARDGRGLPRFAKFSLRSVDQQVRSGFVSGLTTEEIAQNIIADEIRGNMRLGQGAVRLKSDARAVARTALADLSEQVHQQQWAGGYDTDYSFVDDNGVRRWPGREMQQQQRWRWDASNDSRTCPSCSALDGKTSKTNDRSELPPIPLHVQCRCQVLPHTATAQELEAEEAGKLKTLSGVELTTQKPPPQRPKEPRSAYLKRMGEEGWFMTKGRAPSGELYWRRRIEQQTTGGQNVSDYLGMLVDRRKVDPLGSATTLQEYWGGGRAGARRATVFTRLVDGGMDPRDAMQQLFRREGNSALRTLVPVRDLADRYPQWAEALDGVKPILSPRQAKLRAQGKPLGRPRRGY